MAEREVWQEYRDSKHEQTRIAYLFLSLLKDWIHPETQVTFVGPGDYFEVGAWILALKVVNGESSGQPVVNVVERPERSWGIPQNVSNILRIDYCTETDRVRDFFERTKIGLVIVRNPPYITDPSAYQKTFVDMLTWAQEKGAAMLLTFRRGESDDELEQALSVHARRLATPMTDDHLGDDEVIFLSGRGC